MCSILEFEVEEIANRTSLLGQEIVLASDSDSSIDSTDVSVLILDNSFNKLTDVDKTYEISSTDNSDEINQNTPISSSNITAEGEDFQNCSSPKIRYNENKDNTLRVRSESCGDSCIEGDVLKSATNYEYNLQLSESSEKANPTQTLCPTSKTKLGNNITSSKNESDITHLHPQTIDLYTPETERKDASVVDNESRNVSCKEQQSLDDESINVEKCNAGTDSEDNVLDQSYRIDEFDNAEETILRPENCVDSCIEDNVLKSATNYEYNLQLSESSEKANPTPKLCSTSKLGNNITSSKKESNITHLHEQTIDLYTPETERKDPSSVVDNESQNLSCKEQLSLNDKSNTVEKCNAGIDSEDNIFNYPDMSSNNYVSQNNNLAETDATPSVHKNSEGVVPDQSHRIDEAAGVIDEFDNAEEIILSSSSEDDVFDLQSENKASPKSEESHLDRNMFLMPSKGNLESNNKVISIGYRKENWQIRRRLSSSQSDSDDQFENFLTKMKTMTSSKTSRKKVHNLDAPDDYNFINDDSIESDDEGFHHKINPRKFSTTSKLVKGKSSEIQVKTLLGSSFQNNDTPRKVLFDCTNIVDSPEAPIFSTPEGEEYKFVTPKKLDLSDSDGNDMFSDKKNVQSLIKSKKQSRNVEKDNKAGFLYSLSPDTPTTLVCDDAKPFLKNFKKKKGDLVTILYYIFNEYVFQNELPKTMEVTWKPRLTKTAGLCQCVRSVVAASGRNARIQLSTKVIDSAARLRDTLLHEMCHAATWIIYGYQDGHGKLWKYWAQEAVRAFPNLPRPTVCHNYVINTRYTYKCVLCGSCVGRHSKSLDTTAKNCGRCGGKFELMTNNTTSKTPRTPSKFALYVKENYGSVKKSNQKSKHGEVMRLLSADFSNKAKIL